MHRPRWKLRPDRRAPWLPRFAALVIGVLGVVNLVSALTPNVAWRRHPLLQIEPVTVVPIFHALAVPASVVLLVARLLPRAGAPARGADRDLLLLVALVRAQRPQGARRRGGGPLGCARRGAPLVGPRRRSTCGTSAIRPALVALARARRRRSLPIAAASVVSDSRRDAGIGLRRSRETRRPAARGGGADRASTTSSPGCRSRSAGRPARLSCVGAYLALPAARRRRAACPTRGARGGARRRSSAARPRHARRSSSSAATSTTSSAPDGRAFLGYRVEGGVMLVSGDPVGPADALPDARRARRARSPSCAGSGSARSARASEMLPCSGEQAGLRALYLGDEAIVEIARFSLEGRAIRKVRQSVSRLEKAGLHRRDARRLAELDDGDARGARARLASAGAAARRSAASRWRWTSLRGDCEHAAEGARRGRARRRRAAIRGFLHFVPTFGRPAMSLSFMRRDPATPNGLTEFLVVKAIELLARARPRGDLAQLRRLRAAACTRRATGVERAARALVDLASTATSRSRASTASTRSSRRAGSRATSIYERRARPAARRARRRLGRRPAAEAEAAEAPLEACSAAVGGLRRDDGASEDAPRVEVTAARRACNIVCVPAGRGARAQLAPGASQATRRVTRPLSSGLTGSGIACVAYRGRRRPPNCASRRRECGRGPAEPFAYLAGLVRERSSRPAHRRRRAGLRGVCLSC